MNSSELRLMIFCDAAIARNGVGSYYGDLLENLSPVAARVRLIAPDRSPRRWLTLPLPGDRTQQIALPSPRLLKRLFLQDRPQVVIVATPGPYGFLGSRLAKTHGVPIVYGFHTDYVKLSEMYWGRLFGWLSKTYLERMNRFLFRRSAVVLAHSEHMVQMARTLGAGRVELAATLLPAAFQQEPTPPRGALGKVLFIGRLAAEKRIDRLLDAAQALPAIEFSLAGQGPLSATIRRAAETRANVRYLGWLPRERVPGCLIEHDLLVLPSDVESFGTVALEALACGRPALVSTRCGIGEWPEFRELLYFFDPETPNGLIRALQAAAEESEDQRVRRALAGHLAYGRLAEQGRSQWCDLLLDLARNAAPTEPRRPARNEHP